LDFLIKPWGHQLEAINRAINHKSFGLFFEQGTGKTGTAINILRYHFSREKRILRTLIIGPPIVVNNWRDEWGMHSKVPKSEVIPLVGAGKTRLRKFFDAAYRQDNNVIYVEKTNPQNKIFITNYEALLMKDLFKAFKEWKPEVIIFDECHRLKNYKSQRAKLAEELCETTLPRPFVYCLSGTPILNSPMDIYQQFKVLDGGQTFGKNFFAFRGQYFRDRNAGMDKTKYFPKWEVMTQVRDGFDALSEINKKIFERAMRVEKKDCLDLPPEVHQIIKVGMTLEQTRLYKEMKNEFITFMGEKACTASLALTKALRLMQIASGFVSVKPEDTDEQAEAISIKDTPKQEALRTMLEDLCEHSKVLVWCVWKENYRQVKEVCDSLKLKYVEVHGGISPAKKQESITAFKTDPSVSVFIGHPGSGGIGINLVVAPYSIFYSRTFSLEHFLQARARNHRGGSEIHEKITHYDLVCENTIDELVVKALAKKIEIGDKVLRGELLLELEKQET
jgi:SNF2 family DNA or RNA helicase